jgi:hypothetical protein
MAVLFSRQRLYVLLSLIFLLMLSMDISKGQTPVAFQPNTPIKTTRQDLTDRTVHHYKSGRDSFVKRTSLRVLRFGKSLLAALAPGGGGNSSTPSEPITVQGSSDELLAGNSNSTVNSDLIFAKSSVLNGSAKDSKQRLGSLVGRAFFVGDSGEGSWEEAPDVTIEMKHRQGTLKLKSNQQGDFVVELPSGKYNLRAVYDSTGKPLTVSARQYRLFEINPKTATRFDVMIGETDKAEAPLNDKSIVAVVRIIAYDQYAPLMSITAAPQSQPLLVRLQKRIRGRENSPYIKVVYRYGINEMSLPEKLYDGKSLWRFILMRDHDCDSSLREMSLVKNTHKQEQGNVTLPRLNFVNETESPRNDVILPCYELRPSNFALVASGSAKK